MRAGFIVLAAATSALTACGFTGNLRFNPGYAELGSPGVADTDRSFGISLGPLPIKLARLFVAGDPEISGILKDVKGVRVYTYEIDGDAERVIARMVEARGRLVARGWQPVVAVRDDGGLVTALVRMDDDADDQRIRGLVVMVRDEEEVVLVNVIGKLAPETFAFAMAELDIELPTVALGEPTDCMKQHGDEPRWERATGATAAIASLDEIPGLGAHAGACQPKTVWNSQ